MDCKGVLRLALCSVLYFTSCGLGKKQEQNCLLVQDSKVVNDIRFTIATKIYEEEEGKKSGYIFFKVYMRIFNVGKNKSFLFASKDAKDYDARYQYLSFNANKDFLLKMDTTEILPMGYNFLPSNEVSNYDELIYSFRVDKKRIADFNCNQLNIQYWYIDRIAGTGNVCFRPQ